MAVKKHVVSPVVKHVIAPVAKAVETHVIAPVAKAAATAYKTVGSAVEGIGNHLEGIAEVRKGGREGRGGADKRTRVVGGEGQDERSRESAILDPHHTRACHTALDKSRITPSYIHTLLPTPTPLHPSPRSAPHCTRQAAKDIANDMGEGLISVGGVLVKGIDEVGKAYVRKST